MSGLRIGQTKHDQAVRRKKELEAATEQDQTALVEWLEDFAWQNRQAHLATLSDKRRQFIEGLDETEQRRAMLRIWMVQFREQGHLRQAAARLTKADFDRLPATLSPGARVEFEASHDPMDKAKLILRWGQTAVGHRIETGGLRQFLPSVSIPELQRFARDELSSGQREALAPMPRHKRFLELLRLYFWSPDRLAELKPEEITAGSGAHGGMPPHRPPGGPERKQ